ncbi:MAG: DUF2384 domain-containing protein [Lewinella sp.]|nr:DUF2384 domain-containing protein [Lewinella sp.]
MRGLYDTVSKSDPLEFWANHGLDYSRVSNFLELNKKELSKVAGVSAQSVRFDHKIPNDLKERLEQIANICNLVAEFFDGDAEKTALWFRTPNPMLGDLSPRDMIRYGRYKRLQKFVMNAREESATSAA